MKTENQPTKDLQLQDREASDLLKVKQELLCGHNIKTDCPMSCDVSIHET